MVYNSISTVVLWVGNGLIMKLKVTFNRNANDTMKNFYQEVEYYNDTFHENVVNVNLNYFYGLYITPINKADQYASMYLDNYGMYKLLQIFRQALLWFTSEYDEKIWGKDKEGEISVLHSARSIVIEDNINGCMITLRPSVLDFTSPCVEIEFSKYKVLSYINYVGIMNLILFLKKADLFTMSQVLVNFLNTPEPGTNRYCVNNIAPTQVSNITPGRKIGKNKNDIEQLE